MVTFERVRELFDFQDGKLVWKIKKAQAIKIGKIAGTISKKGYRVIEIDYKSYKAHRLVWLWYYGVWPDHHIDHINRIKDDNRIENLRLATFEDLSDEAANSQNRPLSIYNKSGYSGVHWHKQTQKWKVEISVKNKIIYLGLFKDKEDAVKARQEAEREYYKFKPVG